jgi:hypothetical protein
MTNDQAPMTKANQTRVVLLCLSLVIGHWSLVIAPVIAQPPVHRLYRGDAPPGHIGKMQLLRAGRAGYYQPVEVRGPKGSLVSLASEGTFLPAESNVAAGGMLIGEVYRLRVGNIPNLEGFEVFPSIEVIDRLCPPPGQATRFPVPVEIEQQDLELAASGKYITRIIYVEDPKNALPARDLPDQQRVYEVRAHEDPLEVADEIGRPIAILRIGSRTPDVDPSSGRFLFDCPSLMLYDKPPKEAPRHNGLELPLEGPPQNGRASRNFPRLPEGIQRR